MKTGPSDFLVTVLIPVYNAQDYIESALRSVMNQSYRNLEILVIDDGSIDRSAKIVQLLAATDCRVRVVSQPNMGISAALNRGLTEAAGSIIVRMDSDDLMYPNRIEVQVSYMVANPDLGFCASYMDLINSAGMKFGDYRPEPTTREALNKMLVRQESITFTHPTVAFRKEAVCKLGGYIKHYEPCEDTELFLRLIESGSLGLVIPVVLMQYRVHKGSISFSKTRRQVTMAEIIRINFFRRQASELYKNALSFRELLKHLTVMERVDLLLKIQARTFTQLAMYDRAGGRRSVAVLRQIVAVVLRPHRAVAHVMRPTRRS